MMESHWIYKVTEELAGDRAAATLGYRFGRISDKEQCYVALCECPPHKTPEEARNCPEASARYEREVGTV